MAAGWEGKVMIKNNLNFIGGQYVPSSSDETLDVLNPTTGEVVGTIPAGTTEDAQMALDSASARAKTLGQAHRTRAGRVTAEVCPGHSR